MKQVSIPEYNVLGMLNQAIALATSSEFITNNSRYSDTVSKIQFGFYEEPVLNSYACYGEDEQGNVLPSVATFNGLCIFMSIFAAIFTEMKKSKNVIMAKKAAKWVINNMITTTEFEGESWTALDMTKVNEFYKKFPTYGNHVMFPAYKELMFKMMIACLSHEIGHLCLGHLDASSRQSGTITRNQEREADSFSCSVVQGTNVGSDFLIGEVLMMISFLYLEASDVNKYSNHPCPDERINNILRSFEQEIEGFGIDISMIKNFMRM